MVRGVAGDTDARLLVAAMASFAYAQADWYATWPKNIADRAMVVDSVKMWQRC